MLISCLECLSNKQAVVNGGGERGWSYLLSKHVRFYTQVLSGHGEPIIDYNFKQTQFGINAMLNDIL
ncbi:phospholipase A [Xenorhabdus sp. Flor]|nr:phospholipase A [Xenorhabdus sp. Flor]